LALYQHQHNKEKEALQVDLLLGQVALICKQQKPLGTRKLFFLMKHFMGQHNIQISWDALFALLRENGLLVRRRKQKSQLQFFPIIGCANMIILFWVLFQPSML
jgi:hypothetical protein